MEKNLASSKQTDCEDCRQSLCHRCASRFAADHRAVELGQTSRQLDATQSCDSSSSTCSIHPSKSLVIYCRDCDQVGCLLCLSLEAHQGHSWCDVDLAAQETRESLSRRLEQVGTKLEECLDAEHKQQRSATALEQSLLNAHTLLRAEVEKLHQDLDRCVEELQCKLEAARDAKTRMESRRVELKEQANRLSTFMTQCQQTFDSASAIEMLRSSSQLHTEATKMVNSEIDSDLLCSSLRVVFTATNLRQYLPQTDVNLVGAVTVEEADITQSDDEVENNLLRGIVAQNEQKDCGLHGDPNQHKEVERHASALESKLLSWLIPRKLVTNSKPSSERKKTGIKQQTPKSRLEIENSWSGSWSGWMSQSSRNFPREVVGIASVAGDLYVMLKGETCILVMDPINFQTRCSITVPEMWSPTRDMAAGLGTLYVIDDNDSLHAHHVDTGSWTKWQVCHRAWSISTSQVGDVLVTSRSARLLLEYAPGGCLRLKIKLPADVVNPNHARRASSDLLVICHGDMTDELQRVCTITNRGEILKYCKVDGTPWPTHLTVVDGRQVYVAFKSTEQVLSFDLHTMTMIDGVVASRNHGLSAPDRLHFSDSLLYVAGNKTVKVFRNY